MLPMQDAPIRIVPYDPAWPTRFEIERQRIQETLRQWLIGPVEHVGSTAVVSLAAKPVIDIIAAVETLENSRPAIKAAETLGYCYAPYRIESMHWFCKPSPAFRTHHLHLVPLDSERWVQSLAFRDYLRAHADIAADYEALKRSLAEKYEFDREAYTEAKGPFVTQVTGRALREGYGGTNQELRR